MQKNLVRKTNRKSRLNCAFQIAIMTLFLSFLITSCSKQEKAESQKPANASPRATESEDVKKLQTQSAPLVKQPERADKSLSTSEKPLSTENIPKMIDFGADKCVPCKMMAPTLVELREEYNGKIDVVFIDVWKNPTPGRKARIRVIPTQIFYDASGAEVFRHEGYYSKEDILAKWKELGFLE